MRKCASCSTGMRDRANIAGAIIRLNGGLMRSAIARESVTIPVPDSSRHRAEGAIAGFIGADLHVPERAAGLVISAHGHASVRGTWNAGARDATRSRLV